MIKKSKRETLSTYFEWVSFNNYKKANEVSLYFLNVSNPNYQFYQLHSSKVTFARQPGGTFSLFFVYFYFFANYNCGSYCAPRFCVCFNSVFDVFLSVFLWWLLGTREREVWYTLGFTSIRGTHGFREQV